MKLFVNVVRRERHILTNWNALNKYNNDFNRMYHDMTQNDIWYDMVYDIIYLILAQDAVNINFIL